MKAELDKGDEIFSLLKSAFQSSHHPQAICTHEGEIMEVNSAFCDFAGKNQSSLIGANIESIFDSSQIERTEARNGSSRFFLAKIN